MSANRSAGAMLLASLAAALTGCAGVSLPPAALDSPESYLCGGAQVSAEALSARVPVADLTGASREALAEATFDDGSPLDLGDASDWFVVEDAEQNVSILREITVDPVWPEMPPDHELISVSWVDAPNFGPGWLVSAVSTCALTVDLGGLSAPLVTLDPERPGDPAARELYLLVTEQTCNSGADAQGRIEIVRLVESGDQIEIVLGVRPRGGAHTCPSNPATPFTVPLSEPLGDRRVVNGALHSRTSLGGN